MSRRDTINLHALLVAAEDAIVARIGGLGIAHEDAGEVCDEVCDVFEELRRLYPQSVPLLEAVGMEGRRK